jgi:hypothetical protein
MRYVARAFHRLGPCPISGQVPNCALGKWWIVSGHVSGILGKQSCHAKRDAWQSEHGHATTSRTSSHGHALSS